MDTLVLSLLLQTKEETGRLLLTSPTRVSISMKSLVLIRTTAGLFLVLMKFEPLSYIYIRAVTEGVDATGGLY